MSKVQLIILRNSAVFVAPGCLSRVEFVLVGMVRLFFWAISLSKVDLCIRRNSTALLLGDPVVEGRIMSP